MAIRANPSVARIAMARRPASKGADADSSGAEEPPADGGSAPHQEQSQAEPAADSTAAHSDGPPAEPGGALTGNAGEALSSDAAEAARAAEEARKAQRRKYALLTSSALLLKQACTRVLRLFCMRHRGDEKQTDLCV